MGLHVVKGGQALLQQAERATVIGTDGMNPFASATAVHFGNFLSAIEADCVPVGTAENHKATLALTLAAYDAAESGRPVAIASYLAGGATRKDRP